MGQDRDGRGGVSFLSQGNGSVAGIVLNDAFYEGRYAQFKFPSAAPRCHDGDGFSDPTGSGGDENVASFPQGLDLGYHMIGTQTILAPTMDFAQGALMGLDKTLADGVEYVPGVGLTALNPLAKTVGAGLAHFFKCKFFFETDANVAECALGFRKAEAYQALIDGYDEMACLNVQYDTTDAFIRTETILNGDPTVTVETGLTMVDGVAREFEVRVTTGGVATFYVDGVKVGSSFTFDDGEVIVPFFHWLQVTGGSDLVWTEMSVGDLWHVRKDINRR